MSSRDLRPPAHGKALLWFGWWGGAVAWTLHLLTAYAIAEFACVAGAGTRSVLGMSLVAWSLLIASGTSCLLASLAVLAARRAQAFCRQRDGSATRCYLANTGLMLSVLFLAIIVVQTVPIFFFLQRCSV